MQWRNLLPNFGKTAKTLALETALNTVITGQLDARNLKDEALAVAVFTLADQIHAANPGMAEKRGWARLEEVQAFTNAMLSASQATRPDGLV